MVGATPHEGGRGALTVYLGAAPGVGKTSAMLNDAQARRRRGDDVVIGVVETHDRPDTEGLCEGLARLPMRLVPYRGTTFEELDLDALLQRRPSVVLVDELAHRCVPGSRHEKRWQDVEELLDAGIGVITSLNVQHLESLAEEVEARTGAAQHETVPDVVVSSAAQVIFVDAEVEQLGPGAPDAGGVTTFGSENLATLRSCGQEWLRRQGFDTLTPKGPMTAAGVPPGGSAPFMVALSGDPEAVHVLRRAAALAQAERAELIGVYVRVPSDVVEVEPPWLREQRLLLAELGGRYAELAGEDVASTVLDFARAEGVRQLVLGATRRSRREEFLHGSVINKAIRSAGPIEVHVIPPLGGSGRRSQLSEAQAERARAIMPRNRRVTAWMLAVVLPVLVTVALIPARSSLQLAGVLLCNLLGVVAVALLGGFRPAVLATIVAFVASDFFYAPPFYSLRIGRWVDVIALITFLVVASVVGWLVDLLARQGVRVARATAHDENLVVLVSEGLVSPGDLAAQVATLRAAFELDAVTLLRGGGDEWEVVASSGDPTFRSPDEAPHVVEIARGTILAMAGENLARREGTLARSLLEHLRSSRERTEVTELRKQGQDRRR